MRGRSGSLTTDSGGADCRRGRCPPNRLRRRTRLPFRCWYLTSHHIYPATTASAEKKRDDVLKPADGVDEGEVAPGADGTRRDAVLRSIACNLRESEAKGRSCFFVDALVHYCLLTSSAGTSSVLCSCSTHCCFLNDPLYFEAFGSFNLS